MKMLLVMLSLAVGASASAVTPAEIIAKFNSSIGKLGTKDPQDPQTPIRFAKALYRIQRLDFVSLPDGSSEFVKVEICKGEMQIDVFDLRGSNKSIETISKGIDCKDATMNKTIYLSSIMALSNEDLIYKRADVKFAWASLWLQETNSSDRGSHAGSSVAGSKDIGVKSFIMSVAPFIDGPPGRSFYSALLEVQD